MSFDLSEYQAGDTFEASPRELSQIISAILAENGTFEYEGSAVTIKTLPDRAAKKAATKPELPNISPEPTVYEKTFEKAPVVKSTEAPRPVKRPYNKKT